MTLTAHQHDLDYNDYLATLSIPDESLFVVDIDLWPIYLGSFTDPVERQYHNCSACRHFIRRYGNLVTIDPITGKTQSAIWRTGIAPGMYQPAVYAMKKAVESANITSSFLSSDKVLGTPVTGKWTHFSVKNPRIYKKSLLTANQAVAEKKEDFRNISRAINEFKLETLEQVTELLKSDALYRSEKILGQAQWLFDLKAAISNKSHQQLRRNIIWKAVADAPAGFCHPRSGMIGTLLDDIDCGLDFSVVAQRFKEKMHPLQYRRPTATPTAGAIAVAEKIVKEMGVERSLERRFATLQDLQTIWTPIAFDDNRNGGVFDHLKKDARNPVSAVAGKITWIKFASDVLPKAKKIEILIPKGRSQYVAFLTALHADSPVIFQWENHISWYHWHGGATPNQYGLTSGWSQVNAVCLPPYMWGENKQTHFDNSVAFIIDGARETRNEGSAIFPEILKAEFHSIRSVIEAHSKKTKIHDATPTHAIGKGIGSTVRVYTSVVTQYEIDRWD